MRTATPSRPSYTAETLDELRARRTARAGRNPGLLPLREDLSEWEALWKRWDRLTLERDRLALALWKAAR